MRKRGGGYERAVKIGVLAGVAMVAVGIVSQGAGPLRAYELTASDREAMASLQYLGAAVVAVSLGYRVVAPRL